MITQTRNVTVCWNKQLSEEEKEINAGCFLYLAFFYALFLFLYSFYHFLFKCPAE